MSREDIIAVASRLFAVFLVIIMVRFAGELIQAVSAGGVGVSALALFVFAVLPPILAASLLWFFPLSIARTLLPVMREPRPAMVAKAAELQAVAFSVLGLWVLAGAVSDLFHWLAFAALMQSSQAGWESVSPDQKGRMVATGAELALGLWLLFGSTGLAGLLHRFRYAGSGEGSR